MNDSKEDNKDKVKYGIWRVRLDSGLLPEI
jgi:hypothetical protein